MRYTNVALFEGRSLKSWLIGKLRRRQPGLCFKVVQCQGLPVIRVCPR